jgi:hypothetical protein
MYNIVQQSKEEKNIKVGNISSNLSAWEHKQSTWRRK